jgi:heme exporter protein A
MVYYYASLKYDLSMTRTSDQPSSSPVLTAQNLSCIRGDRLLFKDLQIALNAGEMLQIFGANGSGKTTLLRILCGLLRPDVGSITWQGQCIYQYATEFKSALLYIGHTSGIKLDLSPMENLRFASTLCLQTPRISPEMALQKVGLQGFEDEPVRTLSAGQRRRAALARLLTTHAKLWIMDELFTSLDARSTQIMQQIIDRHLRDGGTAILTSHTVLDFTHQPIKSLQLYA